MPSKYSLRVLPPERTHGGTVHLLMPLHGAVPTRWLWAAGAWWFAAWPRQAYNPVEMAELGWAYHGVAPNHPEKD